MIRLPYRKALNWYLMAYSGVYLFGEIIRKYPIVHPEAAGMLLKLHIGLFLFTVLAMTPLFSFRPEGKAPRDKAWVRINILEFYVWCIAGCAGMFVWTGLLNYTEGAASGVWISVKAALVAIPLLLALNSRKILFRDDLIPYEVEEVLARRKTDPGPFQYTVEGFAYAGRHTFQCRWVDIKGIMAYKSDSLTYDTVHLALKKTDGLEWHYHEDADGWFVFIDQLEASLQGINPIWQLEVIAEPFATSATVVYEKDRDLAQEWAERRSA